MALAKFFDKSALAAAEILSGFSYMDFERVLSNIVVQVAFDSDAVTTSEGRHALDLSVRLAARLYPTLMLTALDSSAAPLIEEMQSLAKRINPDISFVSSTNPNISVVIGRKSINQSPAFYLGSENWIAKMSDEGPLGSHDSNNPIGAGASACFGAANMFRTLFKTQLFEGEPDPPFSLSLLDFSLNGKGDNPKLPQNVSIGELPVAGIGAIGSSFVWSMANVSGLAGEIHLIDPEKIELSNLQRYVLSEFNEIGEYKVDSCASHLCQESVSVIPFRCTVGEYVASRRDIWMETVVIGVDSAKARWELQGILPHRIINAWTQPEDLGISRHGFLGEPACLMCLYLPDLEIPSEAQEIASALGFNDQHVPEIGERLFKGTRIDKQFLDRIASNKRIPVAPLEPFLGRTLREFYTRAVCGGLLLTISPATVGTPQPVPMAFQSALAGVLSAAELIAVRANLKQMKIGETTRINLLRPITGYLNFPEKKHISKRCMCKDADFVSAYKDRWHD